MINNIGVKFLLGFDDDAKILLISLPTYEDKNYVVKILMM